MRLPGSFTLQARCDASINPGDRSRPMPLCRLLLALTLAFQWRPKRMFRHLHRQRRRLNVSLLRRRLNSS